MAPALGLTASLLIVAAPMWAASGEPQAAPAERTGSILRRTGEERDRFELGLGMPEGHFDFLGTFAYRRFLREGGPFEQSMQVEFAGGIEDYLSEGALSLYYFLRPLKSYRQEWRIRPLLEIGPGTHLVVQIADVEGFGDTAFHTRAYLKGHAYAGAEFLLRSDFGFLLRGRLSIPAHHPLDYAQAAIFLR